MYRVALQVHFDAAHHLNNYSGKCSRTHGHRWIVEVCFISSKVDDTGMVMDFTVIKRKLNAILDMFDHYYLNLQPDFAQLNPTAENIAKLIWDKLTKKWKGVEYVRIYESPDAWAEYYE